MGVYDFTVKDIRGLDAPLSEFRGKVSLVINSATECGFTPQYTDLQKLYRRYSGRVFVILDFPCDQFGHQAPGTNDEIVKFCTDRFGITFPLFSKIDVNGENAEPLFTYLKSQKEFGGFDPAHPLAAGLIQYYTELDPDYEKNPDIKWNFTKFLIDKEGNVLERYEPTTDVSVIEQRVLELI